MRKNKLLLLLALLMTAATGAWATDYTTLAVGDVIKVGDTFSPTDDGAINNWGVDNGKTYTLIRADIDNEYNVTEKTDGAYYVFKYVSIMSSPYIHFDKAFAVTAISDGLEVTNIKTVKGYLFYTLALHESAAAAGYTVSLKDGVKDADKWTISPNPAEEGQTVTLKYNGRLKVKGVKATSDEKPAEEPVTLATPLTIEAITAGTIGVNINGTLETGMKYSVNGGTKTNITSTTTIEGLKAGDKVQFYSNGTGNTAYSDDPEVNISGGTAEVKVYGNIMSLLDEEGFATKTELQNHAFLGLFMKNTKLIDASELLLPAATVPVSCCQQMFQFCTSLTKAPKLPATTLYSFCYYNMFQFCTSLTTAPELPAEWLEAGCYAQMFSGCTSLTSAYVKAAYIDETNECYKMFDGCMATGATLHTTSESKASWEGVMGTGKTWPNWTVTVEQAAGKPAATVTTAPTGAAIVGVGKTTALVSGGVADGGTLMYAVTTTNTKPTSTAGFSDAVPTAEDITASGTVYVWYYVKADDSHSDSEIAATAIEVPVADIVWDVTNISDLNVASDYKTYTKEGVTLSGNAGNISAQWVDYGDPATAGIFFGVFDSGGLTFTAPTGKAFTKIEMKPQGPDSWNEANLGTGWTYFEDDDNEIFTVSWNGNAAASTVGLLTGTDEFGGAPVKSIAFYLSE